MLTRDSPFFPLDPARVILETRDAIAFFDKFPISEGHTLVVPKLVVIRLRELDETYHYLATSGFHSL
jgi:diadenosine tetraphosphate (Ap4A) HIT family hydrolase